MHGPTVETILKEASKLEVDMIVVGSHGGNAMYQLLVGSVSEGIVHKSKCPVLVVPTLKKKHLIAKMASDSTSDASPNSQE